MSIIVEELESVSISMIVEESESISFSKTGTYASNK